jgi:hypothetical protein
MAHKRKLRKLEPYSNYYTIILWLIATKSIILNRFVSN